MIWIVVGIIALILTLLHISKKGKDAIRMFTSGIIVLSIVSAIYVCSSAIIISVYDNKKDNIKYNI